MRILRKQFDNPLAVQYLASIAQQAFEAISSLYRQYVTMCPTHWPLLNHHLCPKGIGTPGLHNRLNISEVQRRAASHATHSNNTFFTNRIF
jgi:hypothetical protein